MAITDLTYRADYLVLPVSLLMSMPEEWQEQFEQLLRDHAEAFPAACESSYRVQKVDCDEQEIKDRYGYRHDRFKTSQEGGED